MDVAVGRAVDAVLGVAVGAAVGVGFGVAVGPPVGVAVAGGAVVGRGAELDDAVHAATRTMPVNRAATEREVMPVIVPVTFWDAWAWGSDVSSSPVCQ